MGGNAEVLLFADISVTGSDYEAKGKLTLSMAKSVLYSGIDGALHSERLQTFEANHVVTSGCQLVLTAALHCGCCGLKRFIS